MRFSSGDPSEVAGRGDLPWSAIVLLAAAHFTAFVDRALPSVVAPLLKAELSLSDAEIGFLLGPAFVLLYVVGMLAAGHWARRGGAWLLAAACVIVWSAGGVLFALADDLTGLAAGRVLLGAGQAAFVPAALLLIGGQADPGRRSRGLSLFTTGSATGRSGALLLGGAVLASLGAGWFAAGPGLDLEPWRAACLLLLVPNVLLTALLLAARRKRSSGGRPAAGGGGGLVAALALVARRPAAFLGIAAAGAGCVLVVQAAGAWIPSLLNRAFDLPPAQAGLLFGVVVLTCAPVGHLTAGWLIGSRAGGRLGPGPVIGLGALLAAACAAALPWTGSLKQALVPLAGLTAFGGMAAAATLIGLQNLTEAGLRAPMGALFLSVTSVAGVGGGPWLTGLASDALGAGGQGLGAGLALTVATTALAVVVLSASLAGAWRSPPMEAPA